MDRGVPGGGVLGALRVSFKFGGKLAWVRDDFYEFFAFG
jgi:hypothetical protein